MQEKFVTDYEGKYYLMIPLSTKDHCKAVEKGDVMVNDLMSAISIAERNIGSDNPNFLKSIKGISKALWKVL